MNMDFTRELTSISARLKREQALIKKHQPNKLQDVYMKTIKNNPYFYDSVTKKYLGPRTDPEVSRRIDQQIMSRMDRNIGEYLELIQKAQEMNPGVDPNAIAATLPKKYQFPSDQLFEKLMVPRLDQLEQQDTNTYWGHPERLKHRADNGLLVRSKSEQIIVNKYLQKKIPFKYEPLLVLPDKFQVYPDFLVYSARNNRWIVHEHAGMLSDGGYRNRFINKFNRYIRAGYTPYEDFFYTVDYDDETIDTQLLDGLIELLL